MPRFRIAIAVLLIPCLVFTGCGGNSRITDSDIPVIVSLSLDEVASQCGVDEAAQMHASSSGESSESCDLNLTNFGGDAEAVLVGIVIIAAVALTVVVVSEIADAFETTEITITPPTDGRYEQELWWGDTVVWFPRELSGTTATCEITAEGRHNGTWMLDVEIPDVTTQIEIGQP